MEPATDGELGVQMTDHWVFRYEDLVNFNDHCLEWLLAT